jgi:poly-gamma-glutamate capsule biosynthesis protein CapA/YwtB (metallophosphatase superfamily)
MAVFCGIKYLFCSHGYGIIRHTKEKASTIAMGWYSLAEQQSQSCKALAPGNMSKWMKDWMLGTK